MVVFFVYQSDFTITNVQTASASWSTNLFAFFLLTVFADKLAAFSGNNCHVRGRIFHGDDGFWLQQTNKQTFGLNPKTEEKTIHVFSVRVAYLLGEDDSSIQEGRDQVVNQQVNFSSIIFLKVFIHLQPLHHATGQHAVGLPPLIILEAETHR